MEVNNCCNPNINDYMRNGYERIMSCSVLPTGSKMPRWKMLWTKIMKEKRKFFDCSSSSVHVPYDPYTYSQNFDQGWAADPDNLSRSFSARFAVPSRIFSGE
ncbi:hypothetical protein PanWU01x14_331630 [Parasponia andersonii]|uniref:Uncharacterized protein n=1 Tax=Parasponia andersonii TaxID=3476 RepID=A0A2P5AHH6_PARAD|nr:hypothetical protein PanWU01x14_331630 [Parasponia andersonii]